MKNKLPWIIVAIAIAFSSWQLLKTKKAFADFEIVIETTEAGITLKSNHGCRWVDLSYSCLESKTCRFVVDASGVRGLPLGSK